MITKPLKQLNSFREEVDKYKSLLLSSRNDLAQIVNNKDEISKKRRLLNESFASLEATIYEVGDNPKLNDGVWPIWYSAYKMALSSDILQRVEPALDAVLTDLDYIIGKIKASEKSEKTKIKTRSSSNISNKFLSEFKIFEKRIREIAGVTSDVTQQKDIIQKAKSNSPLIEHKEGLIWDLYALRNVFAHQDRGKYITNVNEMAFEELSNLMRLMNKPPQAGRIFKKEVFVAKKDDLIEKIIKEMSKNIFTHVPVYENETFVGVFSEASIFEWLADNIQNGNATLNKIKMGVINKKYLNSPNDKFEFINSKVSVFDLLKMFETYVSKGKRLGVVFITKNGSKNERIDGLVTAWDLPTIKDYLKSI